MKLDHFDPPANVNDFDSIPNQRQAWSDTLSFWFSREVRGVEQLIGAGKSQFYNPHVTDTTDPNSTKVISWSGFPQLIANKHLGNHKAALQEADHLVSAGGEQFRPQDEYCEWFVTRDTATQKITRVDFTCEGPGYWMAMAQGYPDGVPNSVKTAGATGSKDKVLELYKAFVSPQVQMSDLFVNGKYNPLNKFNTTHGAMHLTHPANTLEAEINIAAQATVLRAQHGQTLTDQDALICCAGYGVPGRASDPTIGGNVNALARQGASITLLNPVGLYIDSLNTTGWVTPDGTPAANFFTIVRGAPGAGLRAVFQVPPAKGYTISDIKIGGQAIQFGGQIAEHILMKLTGLACRVGASHNQPKGCLAVPPQGCSDHPLFAAMGAAPPPEPHTPEFPSESKTRRR
jgi:hypothetical protein